MSRYGKVFVLFIGEWPVIYDFRCGSGGVEMMGLVYVATLAIKLQENPG